MIDVPFTQYLLPDGRQKPIIKEVSDEVGEKALAFIARGGKFECEMLQNGIISFTANLNDEDIAIHLSENNEAVLTAVDLLIAEAFEYKTVGDPDCEMCEGRGVVSEGEVDDQHDVPCPCVIDEPADFSGSTEGDR